MKKCVTCKKIKQNTKDFFKIKKSGELSCVCLICLDDKIKWNTLNKAKVRATCNQYINNNKENIAKYQKEYREGPAREKRLLQKKEWKLNNRERDRELQRNNRRRRMIEDPLYKLKRNLCKRFTMAIKKTSKTGSAVRDLGCSIVEFKSYIETKWKPGMSWNNWGKGPSKWQIDHIEPLCSFDLSDRTQLLKACNYINLQPLWYEDHIKKTSNDIKCLSKL